MESSTDYQFKLSESEKISQKNLRAEYKAQWREDRLNNFYVYLHRRHTDNKVFYVGKGCASRAWELTKRNSYWKKVAKKHSVIVEILFDKLDEETAFQCEKDVILELKYFEEPLVNVTDGGDGPTGFKFSHESRVKMSLKKGGTGNYRVRVRKNVVIPIRSKEIFNFFHLDGRSFTGTRLEFKKEYSMSYSSLRALYNNSVFFSNGWTVQKEGEDPSKVIETRLQERTDSFRDFEKFTFVSKKGEVEISDKYSFAEKYNLILRNFWCVYRKPKQVHSMYGWGIKFDDETIEEAVLRLNSVDKKRKEPRDLAVYCFIHKDGTEFSGTRTELCDTYEISPRRLDGLFAKRARPSVKGWRLVKDTSNE